jgi:hypothetical protein
VQMVEHDLSFHRIQSPLGRGTDPATARHTTWHAEHQGRDRPPLGLHSCPDPARRS